MQIFKEITNHPKKDIIIWKARLQLDVQNKMNVRNKRDEWQVREMNKKIKQKRLVKWSYNKMIKWNNEINETCDWKWSDDQWTSSCNDVSQNVNLGLHTKALQN
jgi:hypothetical protein